MQSSDKILSAKHMSQISEIEALQDRDSILGTSPNNQKRQNRNLLRQQYKKDKKSQSPKVTDVIDTILGLTSFIDEAKTAPRTCWTIWEDSPVDESILTQKYQPVLLKPIPRYAKSIPSKIELKLPYNLGISYLYLQRAISFLLNWQVKKGMWRRCSTHIAIANFIKAQTMIQAH